MSKAWASAYEEGTAEQIGHRHPMDPIQEGIKTVQDAAMGTAHFEK